MNPSSPICGVQWQDNGVGEIWIIPNISYKSQTILPAKTDSPLGVWMPNVWRHHCARASVLEGSVACSSVAVAGCSCLRLWLPMSMLRWSASLAFVNISLFTLMSDAIEAGCCFVPRWGAEFESREPTQAHRHTFTHRDFVYFHGHVPCRSSFGLKLFI